jgi:hypothetical protein
MKRRTRVKAVGAVGLVLAACTIGASQPSASADAMNDRYETFADADCVSNRTDLPAGGAQRYTKWKVTTQPYCMFAAGIITQLSTGKTIDFTHQQVWSRGSCTSTYFGKRDCLGQRETWADNNMSVFMVKIDNSTQYIGKGVGMAYILDTPYRGATRWTWPL